MSTAKHSNSILIIRKLPLPSGTLMREESTKASNARDFSPFKSHYECPGNTGAWNPPPHGERSRAVLFLKSFMDCTDHGMFVSLPESFLVGKGSLLRSRSAVRGRAFTFIFSSKTCEIPECSRTQFNSIRLRLGPGFNGPVPSWRRRSHFEMTSRRLHHGTGPFKPGPKRRSLIELNCVREHSGIRRSLNSIQR